MSMTSVQINKLPSFRIDPKALLVFFLALGLFISVVAILIQYRTNLIHLRLENQIIDKGIKITETISKLIYKTEALAGIVIQSNGEVKNFEATAQVIIDHPSIMNILLAPGGKVTHVYPLNDNEKLIGFDLLDASNPGNREAIKAKDSGQLVFGGPFTLMQGGQALVGRLPVWLHDAEGQRYFWGLVSVTLRYPDALKDTDLSELAWHGLAFELWRINPDTDEKQIIASSNYKYDIGANYAEKELRICNATWFLRILPINRWYEYPEHWVLLAGATLISFLIAVIIQKASTFKRSKGMLESLIYTDLLTGALNRNGLFTALSKIVEQNKTFNLYYLDMDYLKRVNDTYGHSVGDLMLQEFGKRILLYSNDHILLARVGGDEFILIIVKEEGREGYDNVLWEYINDEMKEAVTSIDGNGIYLSYSVGMATYPDDDNTVDGVIALADKRMLANKNIRHSTDKRRRYTDK